jgi:F0F1-type ATP synthase membrane subunit b/b'
MNPIWTILRGTLTPVILLMFATLARAAEEGGSSGEQPLGEAFKWIHFVIILLVAFWLFRKVLPPVFRRNADSISAAITKATAAKVEAEKQLKEAAVKLASLEEEVSRFRTQAQKEAEAEIERLQAMTKIDVEKVGVAAKAEIEAAERAARVELKALAAKLAVDRAESLVTQQMTPAVQDAMINNFVQSLQGRPN